MDVIKLSARALQPIADEGIRVQQGWYDKNLHALHVTLWLIQDYESAHSDDECDIEAAMVQVNIWSDRDQNKLKERIKEWFSVCRRERRERTGHGRFYKCDAFLDAAGNR